MEKKFAKMRTTLITFLLLLIFVSQSNIIFSQNENATLAEIKNNIMNWSCEPFVKGTFLQKTDLILENNILSIISRNGSDRFLPYSYKAEIDLKAVTKISVQDNDGTCAGIVIQTQPQGIKNFTQKLPYEKYEKLKNEESFIDYAGWTNEFIRLRKNEKFDSRISWMIGYLTKLCLENGNQFLQNEKTETEKNKLIYGTGFLIHSKGYILTNSHVVEKASSIRVKFFNNNSELNYTANITLVDTKNDLAIIEISDSSFKGNTIIPYVINPIQKQVGENVFTVGYPLRASMGDELKLSIGIISSKTGYQGDITSYQISTPTQAGSSGSPLFDSNGDVIGIINSKHSQAENASYAIKSAYISQLINSLNNPIKLNYQSILHDKNLTDQVKIIDQFVCIIEVKSKE